MTDICQIESIQDDIEIIKESTSRHLQFDLKFDEFVKNRNLVFCVIPAKTGIQ